MINSAIAAHIAGIAIARITPSAALPSERSTAGHQLEQGWGLPSRALLTYSAGLPAVQTNLVPDEMT
ncbi:MAG: hypothetical protein AB8B36_05895 [Prochlorococcus sp.]